MKQLLKEISLDFKFNKHKLRIRLLLFLFRLCNHLNNSYLKIIFLPFFVFYRFYSEWICSVELRPGTKIGAPLIIDHGYGIVINKNAELGDSVHIRHGVTIGVRNNKQELDKVSPKIGNNVSIGCNSSILGNITIGDNVFIGAHSLILNSINKNSTVFLDINLKLKTKLGKI